MNPQFALLRQRRFLPLFLTQFLGALNDNVLKNAIVIFIIFHGAERFGVASGLMVNLCAGLFILPFFLFSACAGQWADKFEKSRLIRRIKLAEIGIMLIASIGFYLPSLPWLLGALFLMGLQSTLFGPLKYAILPQHLTENELVGGNALVESGTFLAILLGTILGGVLITNATWQLWLTLTGLIIALLGYLASRAIPPAAAPDPKLTLNPNFLAETWHNLAALKHNRPVLLAILGISWFWFYGAIFLSQFPAYARNYLGGSEAVATLILALFAIGIGIGSLLCEKLSGGKIDAGLVPLGAIGLSLFAIDLWAFCPVRGALGLSIKEFIAMPGSLHALIDLALIGVFGGIYCVPLYALMQARADIMHRARTVAANNIVNAAFMVAAALLAMALLSSGVSVPQLFLLTALATAGVALWSYRLAPDFLWRVLTRGKRKR